jgi:hypothetical protein
VCVYIQELPFFLYPTQMPFLYKIQTFICHIQLNTYIAKSLRVIKDYNFIFASFFFDMIMIFNMYIQEKRFPRSNWARIIFQFEKKRARLINKHFNYFFYLFKTLGLQINLWSIEHTCKVVVLYHSSVIAVSWKIEFEKMTNVFISIQMTSHYQFIYIQTKDIKFRKTFCM